MIKEENLDFWIRHNYNVLFAGHAGVGKTTLVKEAFNRNGLRWKYFSASTMDPWVDLVGVPKEQKDANGNSYLDLVRPREFQNDEIEAIFFDEFNRSHKKVRNACMELLQFKSINGKRFNNLRLIWAAINPDDEGEYDVEKLDPAQEDRFHIKVPIPYEPHKPYFVKLYGEQTANAAIEWWQNLPKEQKFKVSPRRLDYALDVLKHKGDIRYVLPTLTNITKFLTTIQHGGISERLASILSNNDNDEAKRFLAAENNYYAAIEWICKRKERMVFFLPQMPQEKIATLLVDNNIALDAALELVSRNDHIKDVVSKIVSNGQNKAIIKKIRKQTRNNKALTDLLGLKGMTAYNFVMGISPEKPYWNPAPKAVLPNFCYTNVVTNWSGYCKSALRYTSTQERKKMYAEIEQNIPMTMTLAEALLTLTVMDHLVQRSHMRTLTKLPHFMGIVNHCITVISKTNKNMTWASIVGKYGNKEFLHLIKKCRYERVLGEKLYCPTGASHGN